MATSSSPLSQDRLPDWLAEALDVLTARRRLVVTTAIGLVILGAMAALLAPSILPPRPVVGVAVGIAAALLATAVALALDASDLIVRGARHVTAAGGRVDVRVGRLHDDAGPLLAAVARHAHPDGRVRVALAPASRSAAVPGPRAAALAEALARTGRKVLLTDLTRGGTPAAGLSDVVDGSRNLSEVVRFEHELYLARLAVGSDPDRAIAGFGRFVEDLPSDLEVLVAAMPPLAEPGVLSAAETFDVTMVMVEVDRTERVDLIASLDAMDAAHVTSELVLIDPKGVATAPPGPAVTDEPGDPASGDEPFDDLAFGDDDEDQAIAEEVAAEPDAVEEAVDAGSEDEDGDEDMTFVAAPTVPPTDEDEPVESVVRGVPTGPGALVDPDAEVEEPAAAAYSFEGPDPDAADDSAPDTAAQDEEEGDVDVVAADVGDVDVGDVDPDLTREFRPWSPEEASEGGDFDALLEDDQPAPWRSAEPDEGEDGAAPGPEVSDFDAEPLVLTETTPTPTPDLPDAAPVVFDEPDEPDTDTTSADDTTEIAVPAARRDPAADVDDTSSTSDPSPEPAPPGSPEPEPVSRVVSSTVGAEEVELDPAALEAARTSAALHQLAQQIWDREEQ